MTRQVDGLSYHLSLTDTAGQEEYRGLWAASNLQSDAFLLVYDITNHNSLEGLQWFLDMISIEAENRLEENNRLLREKGTRVRGKREEGWRVPPIMIVAGNKCDLNNARVVTSKTGWEWARSRGCGFMETSAREMVNIEETFACTPHESSYIFANLLITNRDSTESRRQPESRSRPTVHTQSRPYTTNQWCWSAIVWHSRSTQSYCQQRHILVGEPDYG